LYLAIIAIWAGVLIPRWLRRDPARADPAADVTAAVPEGAAATDSDGTVVTIPDPVAPPSVMDAPEADDAPPLPRAPVSPGESRRRVLAARRRLLWMLLALEAAADLLAASGLAAWWVIAPPTVMLAGYLLLLREAAHADAERDSRERDATPARDQVRQAGEADEAPDAGYPLAPPAVPAAFAAAPVPEDYEDLRPGRDFTPGGRATAWSDASAEDDSYDQYPEERLRAVGD
jgi:hypothetical protein